MNIGFIGAGNMARAIMGGVLESGIASTDEVRASDPSEVAQVGVRETLGVEVIADNAKLAAWADVLVLAVKPIMLEQVISEVRDAIHDDTLVISIAAGKQIEWLELAFWRPVRLVRVMPNTPALVGSGVSGLCANQNATEEHRAIAERIFEAVGACYWLSEPMIDVIGAVAGSSPAFVAMFIEALADAAVAEGMPRAQALDIAARTVAGSAELAVVTGKHPGELKDMVTSPGGTTIEGVQVLEERGMRAAVMQAVRAAVAKTKQL